MRPGKFPEPQCARNLWSELGGLDHKTQLLLIGDSAHAFPPDLGLGVNSALEDLELLAQEIAGSADWRTATRSYAEKRLPEAKALVRLVQTVFPEQYATRKWATRKWAAQFILTKLLHKIVPFWINKPAFLLTQNPDLLYSEIERVKLRTERNLNWIGGVGLGPIA